MDPFSTVSTSILTAKAAGNLLSGLTSSMKPAAASFRETFSQILGQGDQQDEETAVRDVGHSGLPGNHSLGQLAARLQKRLAELLAKAGLSPQSGFELELTPLGSVYVNPNHSNQTPMTVEQQFAIERILEGDEEFKGELQQWMSLSGSYRFPHSVDDSGS